MQVKWIKCGDDKHWCRLLPLKLEDIDTLGVYVIGYQCGASIHTVYVGQGDIKDRLTSHRSGNTEKSKKILAYAAKSTLFATWAAVGPAGRDGVERYVSDQLKPLIGSHHPDVEPIPANLPATWK